MSNPDYPAFENRWRITGQIATLSPLHIGDGFSSTTRIPNAGREAREVQTVCCGPGDKPFIPASSLKGALRAWLKSTGTFDADWAALLGSDNPALKEGCGGALSFWDADFADAASRRPNTPSPNFWCEGRGTDVAVSVSIERRTRTALAHHLFHVEYVPAGTRFQVELTGQNIAEGQIRNVLGLLDCLNGEQITLGAYSVHGWGRVRWENPQAFCLDRAGVEGWLTQMENREKNAAVRAGFAAVSMPRAVTSRSPTSHLAPDRLQFELVLKFHSPLLVRDPAWTLERGNSELSEDLHSRLGRAEQANTAREAKGAPHAQPLLDPAGVPFLPARAVRGVLRSRAEAILRTLGYAIEPPEKSRVIKGKENLTALNPVTYLFGVSGWRGVLGLRDFVLAQGAAHREHTQEFIAIDRFTGGGANKLKFNTVAIVSAGHPDHPLTLEGVLTVDLTRLLDSLSAGTTRGLLALLLRDVAEGDLTFGSGAAKGYGVCTAEARVKDGSGLFPSLNAWFDSEKVLISLDRLRVAALPAVETCRLPASTATVHA